MITVEEYREVTKDYKSSIESVQEKIQFLESLCRNIIRDEIKDYVRKK